MLLAAMLAMVLAAAVPALAQSVTQVGEGNVACVQTAVQEQVATTQVTEDGDNLNVQNISQECNISVSEAETAVKYVPVKEYAPVKKYASPTATATATATAAPVVQYEYKKSVAPAAQYE